MAESELVYLSAKTLGDRIREKAVSPVEVVRAFLDRSEALNPSLNAYITILREHAEARAREAEAEIVAGRYRGPLHGIPYAPKDILATKGIRTTNGSKVTATWVPAYESTITNRLNEAGAILVGKLNLLEFAMGSGVVSGFGPARNPWHRDYTPSGSSSGSGVALAAHLVPISIGTDTGGSIRSPAALCGIVGLKQTYGLVSRYGVTTLSWTLDHAGPMTRTVEDAALTLQAIAGPDSNDATCSREPVPSYLDALARPVTGLRVGVPTAYFFDEAAPEVDRAVRQAVDTLRSLGATVVDVEVPHAHLAGSAGWTVAMAEAACFHERRLRETPELFDPLVRERLETAKFYTATDYIKALRVRTILQNEMERVFERCDVMAVPGSLTVASKLDPPERARTDVRPGPASPFRRGNTFLGNMTGLPSMAVPCGFSSGTPTLPISLLLYARGFDESTLLRVGHAYQQVTDWHTRRPAL
ncbi:MAG: amidase [Vicinamibacterales bacterium]